MKKKLLFSLALCASLLMGATQAKAQSKLDVPPLDAELTELADEVIAQQISDPDAANKSFTKLFRKMRNNKEELVSAGKYFLDKKVYPCAKFCADGAYKLDAQYLPALMLGGEVYMTFKDYGTAGQRFDEALLVDSTLTEALELKAFVYKNVNPHVAIEALERIKRLDPNNFEADKDLGDIAYNMGDYKKAVKHYDPYYKGTPVDSLNERSLENYMNSLYATSSFVKALGVLKVIEPRYPNNLVFKRMNFICNYENYDLPATEAALSYIRDKQFADSLYLYLDYAYASKYMKEKNDTANAILYMEKAVAVDSSRTSAYKDLSSMYQMGRDYDKAIGAYTTYLAKLGEKAQPTDLFQLGVLNFYASQNATGDAKTAYVAAGDTVFARVATEVPDSYLGPQWRARINNIDDKTPLDNVRAFYVEALNRIGDNEKAKSAKLESLQYLAWYALQKDQNDDALKYSEQILQIDPQNTMASQIKSFLERFSGQQ